MNSLDVAQTREMSIGAPLLRRLGWAGFLFFLIKGMLWLTVPAVAYLLA